MKQLIESKDDGLIGLLGEEVTFFCVNYIYSGKLVGVNDTCVKLEGASIVYETGAFSESGWKDAQALPTEHTFIQTSAIESFWARR